MRNIIMDVDDDDELKPILLSLTSLTSSSSFHSRFQSGKKYLHRFLKAC
jgi:hypothetical protein